MGEAAIKNNVSTAHLGERFVRHPLTGRNLKELDIADKTAAILQHNRERLKRKAEKKTSDGKDREVYPTGFSLNKGRFGSFPDEEETAHQRGWRAYMTVGVPLIEERSDITQPPPDVISKQTFVNRTDPKATDWSHAVEFSITNTISWSLQGQVQLTFGAKATASLQAQLQKSMALNQSQKTTLKNSKDNQGVDSESQSQTTSTTTATGTATGTGEVSAQLMLGITASISGSLTTGFKTTSTLSGKVGSRVDVLATQRRQVRRFDYEFPVSFGGWVALHYPEPVEVKEIRPEGPQAKEPKFSEVIAWKLGETGTSDESFSLNDEGKPFRQKGEAEVVSTLAGVHEVFELEKLDFDMKDHPLHKGGGKEEAFPRKELLEKPTGLGWDEGLALDADNQKAYITERYNTGKLHKVDLATGKTEWSVQNLGEANDVALDLPGNKAYVADYSNKRVVTVDLSNHSAAPVEVAKDIGAYGIALDLPGKKAYVSDYDKGELIQFDLAGKTLTRVQSWKVTSAAGVALQGDKAYVVGFNGGTLFEVDLKTKDSTPKPVATALGSTVRVALDGTGHAYVSDTGGKLREVVVADGEAKGRQRVVAEGIGSATGVALDQPKGLIYVTNREGRLWRISNVLPGASAES